MRASLTVTSIHVGGKDRKTIAYREREPNTFLVLCDVKTGSDYRSIAIEDSCEQ
jgi:hypothetical protein